MNHQEIMDLLKLINENGLGDDARINALLCAYAYKPDQKNKELLQRFLEPRIFENALQGNPFSPYPTQNSFRGDIIIGLVGLYEPYQKEILRNLADCIIAKVPPELLCKHLLFCGATGSGKTVFFFNLQDEFLKLGKNYISLGFKRDGRHRIKEISNLLVFRIANDANFKWNITIPPKGVSQRSWDLTWIKILCETQGMSLGMDNMLLNFVKQLRLNNSTITIEMIYREIERTNYRVFREANWRASLLNRLDAMCDFNKMLNTKISFPLEELVKRYCLEFELDESGEFRGFFGTLISVYIYKHRITNNLRGNELHIPIFCDEMLFLGSKVIQRSSFLGEPTLFGLIRLIREFGVALISATSEPTALSDTLKTNSAIKILGFLGRSEESFDIGRGMGLSKEQLAMSTNFLPGQVSMKIENIKQILVTFPYKEIIKDVTNRLSDLHNEEVLKGTEFECLIKPEEEKVIVEESKTEKMKPEEIGFLWDVYNRPFLSIKERMESINL